MNRLRLDITLGQSDNFELLGNTYRDEGLTVGHDHMRVRGNDISLEVKLSDIVLGERIGQGACSSVFCATNITTMEKYAVKMFNVYDRSQASQLIKEITMLTSVDCDALISLKGAFHNEGSIGVILEYMDRGSLDRLLNPNIRLTENVFAAIIYQITWGLGYLHFDDRLHRDVKPANVLINSMGQVKLSDFGISKELDSSSVMSSTAVGTFKYMSPERLLGQPYDKSADMWSVGILIVELWTKVHPFSYCCSTPIDLIAEIETYDLDIIVPNTVFPPLIKEIISYLLMVDPNDRITCTELLQCQWFTLQNISTLSDAHKILQSWIENYLDEFDSENYGTSNESKADSRPQRFSDGGHTNPLSANKFGASGLTKSVSTNSLRHESKSVDGNSNYYDDPFESESEPGSRKGFYSDSKQHY